LRASVRNRDPPESRLIAAAPCAQLSYLAASKACSETAMTEWKRFRDDDGDDVWVNMGLAIWVRPNGDGTTRIAFHGEDELIDVQASPEQVLGIELTRR
jgi:SH3-like domain-containing protein